MRIAGTAIFMLSLLIPAAIHAADENTQTYLNKFGTQLSEAWRKYPQEKDALIRKQKVADLTAALTPDLKQLEAPKDYTLQKAVNNFFNNLEKTRTLFTNQKMNAEKSAYTSACATVFKLELPFCADIELPRTASKCFDQLVNWCDDARSRMRLIPEDSQSGIFSSLNEAFMLMMKSATKDEADPSTVYENQIKDIQKRCPVNTPALMKINQPIKTMLEGAAKKVLDFNKKA